MYILYHREIEEMGCVFVGLGGNIGDTAAVFQSALNKIRLMSGVSGLTVSRFFRTTPVSPIPQADFLNAVCSFSYEDTPWQLLKGLQQIQEELGQQPKCKDVPRIIDLDILLFGNTVCKDKRLEIPHPRMLERLFVLIPLLDLVDTIPISQEGITLDIKKYIEFLPNLHHEQVVPLQVQENRS